MKQTGRFILLAIGIAGLLGASHAFSQGGREPGSPAPGRVYDSKTVETVQGKVVSVDKTSRPQHRGYGIHLTVKTDKETIPVHLGPAWYLEKRTPHIEAGDTVEVTGSRVTADGKPAIIAAQIKKGNDVLTLRNENGVPTWSSGGRRGQ